MKSDFRCSNCDFYDAQAKISTYPETKNNYNACYPPIMIEVTGICRKLSYTNVHKKPDEWCGQHSEYNEVLIKDALEKLQDILNRNL